MNQLPPEPATQAGQGKQKLSFNAGENANDTATMEEFGGFLKN